MTPKAKEAKRTLQFNIKFIENLIKTLRSEDEEEVNFVMAASAMLNNYINHRMQSETVKFIESVRDNK